MEVLRYYTLHTNERTNAPRSMAVSFSRAGTLSSAVWETGVPTSDWGNGKPVVEM